MDTVAVVVGGKEHPVDPDRPFVFGRADTDGVVGLDPLDMGISAQAGSIEFSFGVWWVVNRSRKRRLILESTPGAPPHRLDCGDRQAITQGRLTVLVPGAVYTHRIEVIVPDDVVSAMRVEPAVPTGTITLGDARLSEKDRDALAAVCRGYLRSFPRRDPHPLTYQEAAEMLGPPWTRVTLRKQIERIKERLARNGLYFEGPHANHDLAEHLIENELLSVEDLERIERRAAQQ